MRCKLCDKDKKLIKAHIIPRKFYNIKSYGYSPSNNKMEIVQSGAKDNTILCADCDSRIGELLDKPAYDILLNKKRDKITFDFLTDSVSDKRTSYYKLFNQFDYELIIRFFISVLYRASISNMKEFKMIKLGNKFEKAAKEAMFNEHYNSRQFFSVALLCFSEKYDYINAVNEKIRLCGVNTYIIWVGSIKVFIRCDQRKWIEPFYGLQLAEKNIFMLESSKNPLQNLFQGVSKKIREKFFAIS